MTTRRKIVPDNKIVETFFIKGINNLSEKSRTKIYDSILSFCIDFRCNVRNVYGFVSMDPNDDHPDWVPYFRYQIHGPHHLAHDDYVEIELPNPQINFDMYVKVRDLFLEEIENRLIISLR